MFHARFGSRMAIASVGVLTIGLLGLWAIHAPGAAAQVITTGGTGTSAASSGITVEGQGIVTVVPDEATLSVGVESRAATASAAQADASAAMTKVIAAVKAQGVADADLVTQQVSLQPQIDNGPTGNGPSRVTGYIADQTLGVTVRVLDHTGAIIDAAVAAGANSVGGPSFSLADPSKATTQARTLAITDARQRAQTLAQAAGVSLEAPIVITEQSAPTPVPFAAAAPSAGGAATPIQAGTSQVEVDVTVTYAIGG